VESPWEMADSVTRKCAAEMHYASGAMEPAGVLGELCALAAARAERRGHDLDEWVHPPGEVRPARRAVCRRCGRVVYVRIENQLKGIAGTAVHEPCLEPDSPSPA
jgi:hypothetical protein